MRIDDLIIKLKDNTISYGELMELRRLVAERDPDTLQDYGEDYSDNADQGQPETMGLITEKIRRKLNSEIFGEDNTDLTQGMETANRKMKFWRRACAAAVVLALVSYVLFFCLQREEQKERGEVWAKVETGEGENTTVTLPDSTEINIGGSSILQFPAAMTADAREVRFNGSGYFRVAHIDGKVFWVVTSSLRVEVTGTSFQLYTDCDGDRLELILDEGSVSLYPGGGGEPCSLTAGKSVIYDKANGTFDVADFTANAALRHRAFGISYDNVPADSLIQAIEKAYGVRLSNEIRGKIDGPFTGTLPEDDLDGALEILGKVYGFKPARK